MSTDYDPPQPETGHKDVHAGCRQTITELRTKVEIRSWVARASLAVNGGVVAGLIVKVLGG